MPLHLDGATLRTAAGDCVYAMPAGIPQFLRFQSAESEQTTAKLERLNQLARDSGWRSALDGVYGKGTEFVRYVTEVERASFIDLLPLTPNSDVLEIGPGLGQFTALLARRARSVCALEVVAGQAEFAAERCRQDGITNVQLAVGGDDCRLPYQNECFDMVVLNLVFEWCASRCLDESITNVQRRLLDEIFRVLKVDGSLYLATKNRFALRFLIGKPDEHCYDIPFGSALPRSLTQYLVRRRGYARSAGFLYSYKALQAILRDAGFERVDSFWAAPEMRFPTCYVPTDPASIREARRRPDFVQGESRSARLLMPLIPASLVKHVTPGLVFLASKRG